MKKTFLLLAALVFSVSLLKAQPPKGAAKKGTSYGIKVSAEGAISPDDVAALLKDKESAEVTVKGQVASVCEHRGCFIYIKTATGKMYIKTKNDAFFVPLALKGKTVLIKGTASIDGETKEPAIEADGISVI